MRTIPSDPNQPLRRALRLVREDPTSDDVRRATVNRLLASTLVVTHDGTLVLEDDGTLPKGTALPLGIWRDSGGSFHITAFSDEPALLDPDAPAGGAQMPAVAIAGDDLVLLAASNNVGIHVNPGIEESLVLPLPVVRRAAERIERMRQRAGVTTFDEQTLVTLRPTDELDEELAVLFAQELRHRGAQVAYVAEYALHDRRSDPTDFTQIVVVGDEDGAADYALREDARTVLAYLTGAPTDSVAFNAMPQVQQVTEPFMVDGEVPFIETGIV